MSRREVLLVDAEGAFFRAGERARPMALDYLHAIAVADPGVSEVFRVLAEMVNAARRAYENRHPGGRSSPLEDVAAVLRAVRP